MEPLVFFTFSWLPWWPSQDEAPLYWQPYRKFQPFDKVRLLTEANTASIKENKKGQEQNLKKITLVDKQVAKVYNEVYQVESIVTSNTVRCAKLDDRMNQMKEQVEQFDYAEYSHKIREQMQELCEEVYELANRNT